MIWYDIDEDMIWYDNVDDVDHDLIWYNDDDHQFK